MNTTLMLIDIQNDYFPGGNNELFEADLCAERAARRLHCSVKEACPSCT